MAGVFRHRPLGVTKNKSRARGISALAPLMAAGFFRSFPATGRLLLFAPRFGRRYRFIKIPKNLVVRDGTRTRIYKLEVC